MHKLGLMMACSAEGRQLLQLTCPAEETLARGGEVYLYLIDEGVKAVNSEAIQQLRKDGVHVFCCSYGAKKRGVPWDDKATFGGLTILADMIESCDSFVALTPVGVSTTHQENREKSDHTLIIVSTDPEKSHLPAEAVRIAAGIKPWMKTQVDLLLQGPATKILMDDPADLVDGKHVPDYLSMIRRWNHPIFIDEASANEGLRGDRAKDAKKLKAKAVAKLKDQAKNVILF